MRQERDGGLSLRHGVGDNVDRGTGCVGRDTSSPRMSLHTTLLLAELLRLLRERRRVRQEEAPGEDGPAVLALLTLPLGGCHRLTVSPAQASQTLILGLPLSLHGEPLNLVSQQEWGYCSEGSQSGDMDVGQLLPQ